MNSKEELIIYEEIENALRDSPISETWDGVTQLNIADVRSSCWRRYKERISGADAEQFFSKKCDINVQHKVYDDDFDIRVWKDVNDDILQTLNSLFPDIRTVDLNDQRYVSLKMNDIENSYRLGIGNDVLMRNSVLIDVICDPIVKEFSKKVGEVGKCCTTDWLRSKSKTTALHDLCAKRTDLSGTTDWIMKRYGGSRRESSIFVSLMLWTTWNIFITGGKCGAKLAIDTCIGLINSATREYISSNDGDRTTHTIDRTVLANAVKSSVEKSVPTTTKLRIAVETVIAARRVYAKKYNDIYKEISSIASPKDITPTAYKKSRVVDGEFTTAMDLILHSEFGEAYNSMIGSIFLSSLAACFEYNDLSDALMDMKYMETHNYVICAKANSNYTFSHHCEALYVALTTFDEPYSSYDIEIKRRITHYRSANAVHIALWPRYRTSERSRRYVGSLSEVDRNKLIERGRKCIQGEVYIEENMWLDAMCSNFNKRRTEIQKRGYVQSLLYLLMIDDDESAKNYIHSAVKANGMRPFDTGLELVASLGSEWLAKLALRTVKKSVSYDGLFAELSDLLSTLAISCLPIISENTITPCESICGSLCLQVSEILSVVSEINTSAGEAIMGTLAAVITMVSLDPYRCIAHHADMLLSK